MPKNKEEKKDNIEIIPTGALYQVEIDGETIRTENLEIALILNKLEKIDQKLTTFRDCIDFEQA